MHLERRYIPLKNMDKKFFRVEMGILTVLHVTTKWKLIIPILKKSKLILNIAVEQAGAGGYPIVLNTYLSTRFIDFKELNGEGGGDEVGVQFTKMWVIFSTQDVEAGCRFYSADGDGPLIHGERFRIVFFIE